MIELYNLDIDKYIPVDKEQNILQILGSLFCHKIMLADEIIQAIRDAIPEDKRDLNSFLDEQIPQYISIQEKSQNFLYQAFLDSVNDITRLTDRYALNNIIITDFEILILDSLITKSTVRKAFRSQIKEKNLYLGENHLYIKKSKINKRKARKSQRFVSYTPKARLLRQFSSSSPSKGKAAASRRRVASGNENNYKKESSNQPHLIYIASGGMNKIR